MLKRSWPMQLFAHYAQEVNSSQMNSLLPSPAHFALSNCPSLYPPLAWKLSSWRRWTIMASFVLSLHSLLSAQTHLPQIYYFYVPVVVMFNKLFKRYILNCRHSKKSSFFLEEAVNISKCLQKLCFLDICYINSCYHIRSCTNNCNYVPS